MSAATITTRQRVLKRHPAGHGIMCSPDAATITTRQRVLKLLGMNTFSAAVNGCNHHDPSEGTETGPQPDAGVADAVLQPSRPVRGY